MPTSHRRRSCRLLLHEQNRCRASTTRICTTIYANTSETAVATKAAEQIDEADDAEDHIPEEEPERIITNKEHILRCLHIVKKSAKTLQSQINYEEKMFENMPEPVESALVLSREETLPAQVARYHEMQRLSARTYNIMTLNTYGRELEIEGILPRPKRAIIDTGASTIGLGSDFAMLLQRCEYNQLIFSDTFRDCRGDRGEDAGENQGATQVRVGRRDTWGNHHHRASHHRRHESV